MSQTLLQSAVAAYHAGDAQSCIDQCREALLQQPDSETLSILLAMGLHSLGQHAEAADVFRQLATRTPGSIHHWSNLGLMLRHAHRHADAEEAFHRALAIDPRSHESLVNYGLLLLDMGRLAEARHRFLDACDAHPDSPSARIYAALTCFECGDARRAEKLIPPPGVWSRLDDDLRHDLAMALIQVGRVKEAESLLSEAALDGQHPAATARLAMLHERTNRVESAAALLERIRHGIQDGDREMRIDALTVDAALAMRAKDYGRARASTEGMLAMGLPAQARSSAHFMLARVADKQGDRDEAMAQLAQAHAIHFQLAADIVPDIVASGDEPLRIASKWMTPQECRFPPDIDAPAADASPVFIVGFPRSGTTMLEQMLDAHPHYASMDERTILQRCVERMEAGGLDHPHDLARLSGEDLAALRALYWHESAKVVARSPGQVLVDKNPLNMLRLPMIRRLFPNAKVILALRHPCDVILSCYMQQFRSPAFMVLCSSLERLAKSYSNAMRFWIHHEPLMPPAALVLRYEETVSEFPRQVDRIADYLGIEDRAPLARFAEHAASKGYISTPSYSQVVEPVNARAVARWHAYRSYFEPVFPILQPVADHWGYRLDS
jgi:Flp pilus assembly protein TadD